jgi:hypothetical protein
MYDVKKLLKLEADLALRMREHFMKFFRSHDYRKHSDAVASRDVSSFDEMEKVYSGTGFYLILTDYSAAENPCSLEVEGLKAIYRGHCYTVKSRLKSHLFNDQYRSTLKSNAVRYDVCLKLDGSNGINIAQPPYNAYRWRVIVHKMKSSSKMIREQAEHAFDAVFSRPLGSKEAKVKDAH